MTDWDRSWKTKLSLAANHVAEHVREVAAILLPDQCQLCEAIVPSRIGGGLCQDCLCSMPRIDHACLRCGAPIPSVVGIVERCVYCRDGRWPAERVFAWGVYREKLRDAVVAMKNPGSEPLAFALAAAMVGQLKRQANLPEYDLIVSTPKHWSKRFAQHHNSSELLVEKISSKLGVCFDHNVLQRNRVTAKQGTLARTARNDNVRGAFTVRKRQDVSGKTILLVDDIVTSGATVAEMTSVLLASQATRVDVACLARGIGK